jgi:uncharacterized protein
MRALQTVALLVGSNIFMTIAWYGHLKLREFKWFESKPLIFMIILSWTIALPEYLLQVPANRLGFKNNGGPFSLLELKVIQEVITLLVFVIFSTIFFKTESFRANHFVGLAFLILAVYFIFKP